LYIRYGYGKTLDTPKTFASLLEDFLKEKNFVFHLFSGMIVLVVGAYFLVKGSVVLELLPILLGAFVLTDVIWTLRGALKLRKVGQDVWKLFLFICFVFFGLGIAIMYNPFRNARMVVIFAGWVFFINGILDIICMVLFHNNIQVAKVNSENMEQNLDVVPQTNTENVSFTEGEPLSNEYTAYDQQAGKQSEVSFKEEKKKFFRKKKKGIQDPLAEVDAEVMKEVNTEVETGAGTASISGKPEEKEAKNRENSDSIEEALSGGEKADAEADYAEWL
ncbi:MAG: hypothetical protein HUJ72_01405, partial [Blautia sp.]|nr:hypothetical protein [Blautia sp.]